MNILSIMTFHRKRDFKICCFQKHSSELAQLDITLKKNNLLSLFHEAEILAKASNCFRTEATALVDSFFLGADPDDAALLPGEASPTAGPRGVSANGLG